tara:strand:+ start:2401 stop:2976 length:576 start_codon:yes stop_codon:yes gene_type:complete
LQYTDEELIQLLLVDDRKAFEIIYRSYWERLYAVAYNRLNSKENAEGLIQEIFTELWEKRSRLHIHKSLTSFLFSALKYKIFNLYASQSVRRRYINENKKLVTEHSNETEEWLSFEELYGLIESEINKLPEKCNLVFRLNQKGQTSGEIAEQLGVSKRTVEGHLDQARKKLRVRLSDLGITASAISGILYF